MRWSGRNMRKQLHKSTDIREARLADYALLVVQRQTPKYMYDGWEKNDYVLRSHIVQFYKGQDYLFIVKVRIHMSFRYCLEMLKLVNFLR